MPQEFTVTSQPSNPLLGHYNVLVPSGAVAATLAAGSTLLSFRWASTTSFAVIEYVSVDAIVSGAITTAVLFDLELVVARSFSAADTGGTAVTLTGNNQKRRSTYATSGVNSFLVASAGALTPGTRTPDAQAIGRVQGFTGTTVGTKVFQNANPSIWLQNPFQAPVVLLNNEGILIRNPLVGPGTGTVTFNFLVEWSEYNNVS